MLHRYGKRIHIKTWGEINFSSCEEVQHAEVEVSVAGGSREMGGGGKKSSQNRYLGA